MDAILQHLQTIILYENCFVLIHITLQFVAKDSVDYNVSVV